MPPRQPPLRESIRAFVCRCHIYLSPSPILSVPEPQGGALGTILDPTLTGLQPTVAGLGLGVLVPTVEGLKQTVDTLKRDVT